MEVEHKEYTGKGQGNFNTVGAAAGIASFFGINADNVMGCQRGCGYGDTESKPINRYEAGLHQRISTLESEVKLRDANTYTMTKMGELRDYVDAKFDKVNDRLCAQAEWNAAQTGALTCMQSQIAQLLGLTKLVIPNPSVCPGWGGVTITPAASTPNK